MERNAETTLAEELLKGESGAFERFVEHFRSKIFNYSWLMCGQREDAEEVAQETLLRVFGKVGDLREPERVRPWVFRIAKNACLTKRRRSLFAPSASQEISLDTLMPGKDGNGSSKLEIADWSSVPEDQVMRSELQRELQHAIQELPEIYRAVILLRDVEELTTQETAQILDVTEDVVKTRLHRARLMVRKYLDERLQKIPVRPQ